MNRFFFAIIPAIGLLIAAGLSLEPTRFFYHYVDLNSCFYSLVEETNSLGQREFVMAGVSGNDRISKKTKFAHRLDARLPLKSDSLLVSNLDNENLHQTRPQTSLLITRVDDKGLEIKSNVIGGLADEEASDIVAIGDGNYFVVGTTRSLSEKNKTYHAFLMKLNSELHPIKIDSNQTQKGNHQKKVREEIPLPSDLILAFDTTNHSFFHKVIKTTDGSFFILGTFTTSEGKRKLWVLKVDSNGKVLWQNNYEPVSNQETLGFGLSEVLDGPGKGELIIVGALIENDNRGEKESAWIFRIEPHRGDYVWSRIHQGPFPKRKNPAHRFYSVAVDENSNPPSSPCKPSGIPK
jgi:hypothetical protein